jgi:rhodanese-related sulfurtransferase
MPTATIAPPELRRLKDEDPNLRVIDVRTGAEFEGSHIPGSYNIPLDTLGEHAGDLAAVDYPVVLVCQSGGRAESAQGKLGAAGKSGLYVLEGGMNAWQAAGGEVSQGDRERWAMDRQVRLVAGSFVLAGVLASIGVPKAKWLAAGVGGGLVFSALSNTCAMANVLGRLPYNRGAGCDIESVLAQINRVE